MYIIIQWLESDFLQYLKEWEECIEGCDVDNAVKPTMCLSRETLEGLRITGRYSYNNCFYAIMIMIITVKSFVEMTRYLLSLPGYENKYILSECFSQDPLENFFGQLRAKGGRCDNPTVQSCMQSTQSLRVQGSASLQPVRGNSTRKRRLFHNKEEIDSTSLPKRARVSKVHPTPTPCPQL